MFSDGGMALSNYDDLAMGVRKRLTIGVADPAEVWLPVVVASTKDTFTLKRVAVRLTEDQGSQPLGTWSDIRRFQHTSRDVRTGWARNLGRYYAFACVRADLSAPHLVQDGGLWLVIEAEVDSDEGDTRRLAATTFLDVSPLPAPDGWHAGDTHMHTTESDGILSLDATVGHARGASGLSWMVVTDHAIAIQDWRAYVDCCLQAQNSQSVLVCPGAEFAAHRFLGEGHALGYWMRTDVGSELPPAVEAPQDLIHSIREQGPSSFAAIAHPYNWRYEWPDWRVTGFRAMELATGGGATAQVRTIDRWFRLLRQDLSAWSGAGDDVSFVVGLASTDSHSVPLSVMPGERHVNWVFTGDQAPPADAESLFKHLRDGHCVASCGGDFGALSVNGSGPGSVCTSDGRSPLVCQFQMQPRTGNQLVSLRLYGPRGKVREFDSAEAGSFTYDLEPPQEHCFYVARFVFSGKTKELWEVWTNPVWVRRL